MLSNVFRRKQRKNMIFIIQKCNQNCLVLRKKKIRKNVSRMRKTNHTRWQNTSRRIVACRVYFWYYYTYTTFTQPTALIFGVPSLIIIYYYLLTRKMQGSHFPDLSFSNITCNLLNNQWPEFIRYLEIILRARFYNLRLFDFTFRRRIVKDRRWNKA